MVAACSKELQGTNIGSESLLLLFGVRYDYTSPDRGGNVCAIMCRTEENKSRASVSCDGDLDSVDGR